MLGAGSINDLGALTVSTVHVCNADIASQVPSANSNAQDDVRIPDPGQWPRESKGTVFDGTNLRIEWEKACAACGLGTRVKIEGERFLRTDRKQPRRVKNGCYRYNGFIVYDLRRFAIRNLINAEVPDK